VRSKIGDKAVFLGGQMQFLAILMIHTLNFDENIWTDCISGEQFELVN
jgi:hypothetical protein